MPVLTKICARYYVLLATLLVLIAPGIVKAAPVQIQHDIDGSWKADESRPMQCFRVETEATCVMVNQGFSHRLDILYISPTKLSGTIVRRNRADSCVTHMNAEITMVSGSSFAMKWTALDSNCDLQAGQSGVDPLYSRVL